MTLQNTDRSRRTFLSLAGAVWAAAAFPSSVDATPVAPPIDLPTVTLREASEPHGQGKFRRKNSPLPASRGLSS